MIHRVDYRYLVYDGPAPEGSHALERDGMFVLRNAFSPDEIAELRQDIERVYHEYPPDKRAGSPTLERAEMFRYEMFNRSAACQAIAGDRRVLDLLEPLLGDECHMISCTAWRNPADPSHAPNGQEWHTDGGPHVPLPEDFLWPDDVPFPIFTIATHFFLQAQALEDGPTAALLGSHRSGLVPPKEREWDLDLTYRGQSAVPMLAEVGDIGFFVSDVWHRRLPPLPYGKGRFFLQINYGRRDIAQRIRPTAAVNHVSPDANERARSEREQKLIGLHPERFYDG
ncbi:MAG: phytanoyl-CoA dioxygenase family protein [Planctomycetota bacterium]